jgi:hypothetical protein
MRSPYDGKRCDWETKRYKAMIRDPGGNLLQSSLSWTPVSPASPAHMLLVEQCLCIFKLLTKNSAATMFPPIIELTESEGIKA